MRKTAADIIGLTGSITIDGVRIEGDAKIKTLPALVASDGTIAAPERRVVSIVSTYKGVEVTIGELPADHPSVRLTAK